MATFLFDSALDDIVRGNIDLDTDTFKVMLVTSTYAPDRAAHLKRSAVTNEVTGTGYTAGGVASAATVAKDTTNHRVTISFTNPSWANATITARAAVIYKSRGGAATADELVGYIDFGADVTSTAATYTVNFSAPLTLQG